MLRYLAAASLFAVALPLATSAVSAQERFGDAALGALSGAVVLGPVGAVAGAVVGYTTGPHIAHAWGLNSSPHKPARSTRATAHPTKGSLAPLPRPRPNAPAAPAPAVNTAPSANSPPQFKSAGTAVDAPPVQGFE
ncbi:MAG TPA: DNA-directed RNA polymerase subunit N [Xanthobacteraceae bacterium]|nr:DNA-directed RNA polymerase subunit N [Xanthobacteraceae bacterium]